MNSTIQLTSSNKTNSKEKNKNYKCLIEIDDLQLISQQPLYVEQDISKQKKKINRNKKTKENNNQKQSIDITINTTVPNYLSIKNAHPRDNHISFEEKKHEYTVKGKKGFTSVTTFVHSHFSHFDSTKALDFILNSPKINDPTYKYFGKTKEQILNEWEVNRKQSAESGTKMHYDIECFYNNIDNKNTSIEFEYFKNFVNDFPNLVPYRTEWMVYYEEYKLSGSIDMVYVDVSNNTYQIYDWKRTKGLEYEAFDNKTAITPCINHMPDTNFWHYALQLNLYKRILEDKYGLTIVGLYLICLHPDNFPKNYERVEIPILHNEITELLEWWKNNKIITSSF